MLRPSRNRLEPPVLEAVLDRIAAGVNISQIYTETGVWRSCIRQKRRNMVYWGQPYAPACRKLGRPTILRERHRTWLREYLAGRPHAYLEEIKDELLEEWSIKASTSLVWRELKRMKWSRKVASKRAAEQSDALRRVFQARCQQNYTAEQIVAVDESACNERTGDRKYGWGPVGHSVSLSYSMKRSERWSLLLAMTVDGYLTHRIFQGAITAQIMEEFLREDLLPRLVAGYHVLLMDNASIHRSPAIVQLCGDFGIQLEYLPPYSPDYNPIEKTFKVLKSWMKRHYQQQDEWLDFRFFIELAVLNSCYRVDCRSWYRKCGYVSADAA